VAEILDGVRVSLRRPGVAVRMPRQPDAGRRYLGHDRLRRRSGERGRLRSPVEDDGRVGGSADAESGAPRRLAGLTDRLARVDGRVRQPQSCTHHHNRLPMT